MRAPVKNSSTGVEVVVTTPFADDVLTVVRTPYGRAEPHVPVTNALRRSWLARQPADVQSWHIDGCIHRLQFAQLSGLCELHSLLEVRHTSALSTRLEDSAGGFHGVGQLLAQLNCQATRLFAVNVLARLSR